MVYKSTVTEAIKPSTLKCEYRANPLGIDVVKPRLSWILESSGRGQKQTAYRVVVASSEERLEADKGDLWDSNKVASDRSIQVEYAGKPLRSRMHCYWKVRVWDKDGQASTWSEPAMWSMGLLTASDWQASWIADGERAEASSSPWLRKTFTLDGKPKRATVYVAAVGSHELYLNGMKVDNHVLGPAVSNYRRRALYLTHEVTEHLVEGPNCMALWLGRGWTAFEPYALGHGAMAMAQLEVMLADGRTVRVGTDQRWKTHPSPITFLGQWQYADYGGERYDATREVPGWNTADFDDSSWQPVSVFEAPMRLLSAQMVEPNRVIQTIHPVKSEELSLGIQVIDMGRNYTGWLELRVTGPRGQEVKLEYFERPVQAEGLPSYKQRDEYILRGEGTEVFRNRFNYRAFRWVKVTGLNQPLSLEDVRGYLIHTDYEPTGEFECSNDLLNRIYQTVLWTYRCLSLGGYVVDCPHRERLGFGAEGQVAMESALYNFDQGALFTKWMTDWRDVQDPKTGEVPGTAPTYIGGGGPAWGGIVVTLPWQCYLQYGDKRILETCYPTMQMYLRWLDTKTEGHVLQPWGGEWDFIGDWVAPGRNLQHTKHWRMPVRWPQFFNNCYYLYIVQLTGKTATVLGKDDDASMYWQKAQAIKKAVHEAFFDSQKSTYVPGEQPYLAFALLVGMVPQSLRDKVMAELEHDITVMRKGHVHSGVLGTYFLLNYLTRVERNDLIFTMVNQKTYPSWGYMLENGATTIWERWDGKKSLNHTSFLSVGAWFTEGVAGIRADENAPGFKHFFIRPSLVGDLTFARAKYRSICGTILSDWRIESESLTLEVHIPANTTATVYIPARHADDVSESGKPAAKTDGVRFLRMENGKTVFAVGSGQYRFVSRIPVNQSADETQ